MPRNLPTNPNLEHLGNEAKALYKAYRASDTELFDDFVHRWPRFFGKSNDDIRGANLSLGDVQFYLAREYGFDTWTQMQQYVKEHRHFDPDSATDELFRQRFIRVVNSGESDKVRRLLRRSDYLRKHIDADWFGVGDGSQRAIVGALQNGDRWLVVALVDYGASVNAEITDNWTPLQITSGHFWYNPSLAHFLIERGAEVDPCSAAGLGMLSTLRALVSADADSVHATDYRGQTPLHYARTTEVADFLLSYGADINARDKKYGSTSTQWAMYWSHGEQADNPTLARHLISKGAEHDILLLCAIGDIEAVAAAIAENPALVNADVYPKEPEQHVYSLTRIGGREMDALAVALSYKNFKLFEILLNAGGKLNWLHWHLMFGAGDWRLDKYLDILARNGHDINAFITPKHDDEVLMTPLLAFAHREEKQTPQAVIDGIRAGIAVLLRHGADVHVQDALGRTALHLAAANPFGREGIQVLVKHGADVNRRDNKGQTPLDYAMSHDFSENAKILKTLGASTVEKI